jgi:hypothetical protein
VESKLLCDSLVFVLPTTKKDNLFLDESPGPEEGGPDEVPRGLRQADPERRPPGEVL